MPTEASRGTGARGSACDATGRSISHGRRAVGDLRRFAKANRFNYLWTLTYREAPADRKTVVEHVRRFFLGLAVHLGQLAGCAVIERGKHGTHRFHVHFAMQGRVDHAEMQWLWGHGYVFYGDPGRYPGRSDVQRLASYLAKYLGKELEADADAGGNRDPGMHRWLHTQGFMPDCTTRRFETVAPAEAWLILLMASPGRAQSWGREKEDYAFGRFYRWESIDWWPAPAP